MPWSCRRCESINPDNYFLCDVCDEQRPIIHTRQAQRIAAGAEFSLALTPTNTIHGWGANTYQQLDIPAHTPSISALAAGQYHALALHHDGTVTMWGDNNLGQLDCPHPLHDISAIACGDNHSLTVSSTGQVFVWGNQQYGKCLPPTNIQPIIAKKTGANTHWRLPNTGTSWPGVAMTKGKRTSQIISPMSLRLQPALVIQWRSKQMAPLSSGACASRCRLHVYPSQPLLVKVGTLLPC